MKREIEIFPELGESDSDDVVKNFGNTRWNDPDFESEDQIMQDKTMSLMDGTDKEEREHSREFITALKRWNKY